MPRRVVIIGNSHAKRLGEAARRALPTLIDHNYVLEIYAKPGGKFGDVHIPSSLKTYLTPNDVLIIFSFGNSLFPRSYVNPRTAPEGSVVQRIIHLDKFVQQSREVREAEYQSLRTFLDAHRGRVLIIDSPFRHIKCCEAHVYPETMPYQIAVNQRLHDVFQNYDDRTTVLDHRFLLDLSSKQKRNKFEYAKLLPDSVHLRKECYETLFQNLMVNHIFG